MLLADILISSTFNLSVFFSGRLTSPAPNIDLNRSYCYSITSLTSLAFTFMATVFEQNSKMMPETFTVGTECVTMSSHFIFFHYQPRQCASFYSKEHATRQIFNSVCSEFQRYPTAVSASDKPKPLADIVSLLSHPPFPLILLTQDH